MATAEQRAKVLSWKSSLAAPFGAPVYLRKKGFDKSGPLRREQGPETKWQKGRYVGLSGEDKEKFFHTLHVRPNLVEPGEPDVEMWADYSIKPRRRVLEKNTSCGG